MMMAARWVSFRAKVSPTACSGVLMPLRTG
jgi:hypothetical protein